MGLKLLREGGCVRTGCEECLYLREDQVTGGLSNLAMHEGRLFVHSLNNVRVMKYRRMSNACYQ